MRPGENGLTPPADDADDEAAADALLTEAARRGVELVTEDEVLDVVRDQARTLLERFPDRRLRLKAVGGGGGKGQRVLRAPAHYETDSLDAVAQDAVEATREIWMEVAGDERNVLIELNVEANRHLEVQVIGNGDWCVALGLRDCSAQMHEQKLIEASVTAESLQREIDGSAAAGERDTRRALEADLRVLTEMEDEAERFGLAVGLDSVSTFECIVDGEDHYFMEMNTRIQVEHRVTELCYALEFVDPDDADSVLRVESLIEAMALIARHGERLPKPRRVPLRSDSLEVRLNATDPALRPAAGGLIESWSPPVPDEIRDDQGIGTRNPDTGLFAPYYLAGAYDSNIALLLSAGDTREETWRNMLEALRRMRIKGADLQTNRDFHYGLLNWLVAQNPRAKIETRFVQAYLVAVARLFEAAQAVDLDVAFDTVKAVAVSEAVDGSEDELEALAAAVKDAYPRLSHRYYRLKADWLGKERLAHWDRNAPLPDDDDRSIPWDRAVGIVLDAYRAFSGELADLGRRFFDHAWIDARVRPGKAGGAFAHPTVPSAHPYLLLNYQGKTRDVMTLAHELGHGVHQLLAAPRGALLADAPLTLAETASVFGEQLAFRALLDGESEVRRRRAMLAGKVEDAINTVVRQVAFYEFERRLHEERRGGELSAERIGDIWLDVQEASLGPAFALDEGYRHYWSYIPHFIHSPFYVYAYAFGDCLVNSLYAVYLRTQTRDFEEKVFRHAAGRRHAAPSQAAGAVRSRRLAARFLEPRPRRRRRLHR